MPKIKRLPDEVIKKIAAGEVVERPYSVVKELVENSLDAKAQNINVYIEEGGLGKIVVEDDGIGIPPEELPDALLRHTTSKIASFDDLYYLESFGFRGEALYSIAAVSKISIKSRVRGENNGYELIAHAGEVINLTEVGMAYGTVVTVSDLFFNTPARKKFLKSGQTEAGLIRQFIEKMAILYPGVKFSLFIDGKKIYSSAGIQEQLGLLARFWGLEKGNLLMLEEKLGEGFFIKGGIALPPAGKPHRKLQVFAVNKRLVKSGILTKAIDDAYESLLPTGLKPLVFLEVVVPGTWVDVNVHPQKLEVKFMDEQKIYLDVRTIIRNKLVNAKSSSLKSFSPARETNTKSEDNDYWQVTYFAEEFSGNSDKLLEKEDIFSTSDNLTFSLNKDFAKELNFQVIGQFSLKYIIVEKNDKLLIIDQHAAHERILYEKYQTKLNPFYSQVLTFPVRIKASPELEAFLQENYQNFLEIGLHIEPFGPGEYLVREIPEDFPQNNIANVLEEYLYEIMEQKEQVSFREKALKLFACKNAVKFGEKLTYSEMTNLVKELFKTNYPLSCPHGRPTIYELSLTEINKKFFR
ncbi:DNA mismatch repair endonuclease MutL [Carboxydothermus hydrogenoformans]|uniref:DNA mismatch repair protein MutL n=1 Tax=Carboxydothermus hydrogenoformans (strain ATCC BAA-161 / DSM 6008 / Z-2901) TaxID=246194 RepID=MUTL_CARHZ|nr:DNA mismatch repair endonuclease MutL [Carboxydothermus hydrogenoformans]Q3ACA6.1 RecName: Full=DNA mismatch repair protein MutL [Carboxydothermus hydrogenoformans Z-2901]ABB15228.1 DNA mismatch repair protein HexB [Carboxydothermus hydrogenoformans Z-2901]